MNANWCTLHEVYRSGLCSLFTLLCLLAFLSLYACLHQLELLIDQRLHLHDAILVKVCQCVPFPCNNDRAVSVASGGITGEVHTRTRLHQGRFSSKGREVGAEDVEEAGAAALLVALASIRTTKDTSRIPQITIESGE